MPAKYVEQRTKTDGTPVWVVNPRRKIRESTNMPSKSFKNEAEASQYAHRIMEEYDLYRRKLTRTIEVQPGTVDYLMQTYRNSIAFKKLKPNSQDSYRRLMEIASTTTIGQSNVFFGQMLASGVTAQHADGFYQAVAETRTANLAYHTVKVLRVVFGQGIRFSYVKSNPFSNMKLRGMKARETLWEPEEVDRFIDAADRIGFPSVGTLALMCYYLCQRPGDMRKLTWSNLDDGVLEFDQEKTGVPMELWVPERLLERMGPRRGDDDTILINDVTGRPHTRWSYYKQAAEVREAAGLPEELQLRDLRRTGATEMAEAGSTEDELRSITGHKSRGVLSVYVRPTRKLARSAMAKRFG